MKTYITILISLWATFLLPAQNKTVESARVAFISQRVGLTAVQAEKFWPLFNEFSSQRLEIKKSIKNILEKMGQPSEQTLEATKKNIDQMAALKQKEVALEKEYQLKYLLVITPKQFADLLASEKEFQKILLKKVSEE
jgi:Spy/CpxP family protein refolding chaperone